MYFNYINDEMIVTIKLTTTATVDDNLLGFVCVLVLIFKSLMFMTFSGLRMLQTASCQREEDFQDRD